MDINLLRFKLALYCCYAPVAGRLIHVDRQPLSDDEISIYLGITVEEWMDVKAEVLKDNYEITPDGCIKLKEIDSGELDTLFYEKKTIHSRDIQEIINELQSKFSKPLQDYQLLIEYYKRIKKISNQPNWDTNNWKKYCKIAIHIIKRIGLENGMRVIQWVSLQKNFKFWGLNSVLELYDQYWKSSKESINVEIQQERKMFEKYK